MPRRAPRASWRRGFTRPLRRRALRAFDHVIDAVAGIRTRDSAQDPTSSHPEDVRYAASHWTTLIRALPPGFARAGDVFVDFGCGKGRVLYLASFYRFGRVIGVEASPELAGQARANMARARGPGRLRAVEVVTARAEEFEIPPGLRVAYFFNPFRGDVFNAVCRELARSVRNHPRTLRVIYANPRDGHVLAGHGFVTVRCGGRMGVYEIRPASSGASTARS